MDHQNELRRHAGRQEKEQKRKDREKTWEERGKRFWGAFLFTENGKPKSALIIYTFCLSILILALWLASYQYAIEWLTPLTAGWPVVWGNLAESLCASAVLLLATFALHRLVKDKRLALGAWLWLALYAVAAAVTLAAVLRDGEAFAVFLTRFAVWFLLIPLALGLALGFLLYRRDYRPAAPAEDDAPWRKYTRRQ